jgi:DNA repair exonuclease SbcCD ATPase subunit
MYIKHLAIENLKSISKFEMDFPTPAGWHVIIGDNGAGKSSVAMGIALGLNGSKENTFKINWDRFIREDEDYLSIILNLDLQKNDLILILKRKRIAKLSLFFNFDLW